MTIHLSFETTCLLILMLISFFYELGLYLYGIKHYQKGDKQKYDRDDFKNFLILTIPLSIIIILLDIFRQKS